MFQVFGTNFFGAELLYRNILECKKYVSIVDGTDFVISGLTKRNRASRDNVFHQTDQSAVQVLSLANWL